VPVAPPPAAIDLTHQPDHRLMTAPEAPPDAGPGGFNCGLSLPIREEVTKARPGGDLVERRAAVVPPGLTDNSSRGRGQQNERRRESVAVVREMENALKQSSTSRPVPSITKP
jgi:hypothetical protein